jgi:YhcH/YjgK/YiaL family protein
MNARNLLLLIFVLTITGTLVSAQSADSIAAIKKADKWVQSGVWSKSLKLKLHSSVNSVEFKRQYEANKELWDKVFKFLGDSKLGSLAPGKYPIDSNAYASITEGAPKNLEDSKWESHRKYIDLQYVIAGKVKLGVSPISAATVTNPYDESKDAANYTAEGKYYIATPGEFFLFFPTDVHRPDIKVDGYDTLKKLVIKIRYKE